MLNLYLLTQDVNCDYDTYDSCIVAAESEDEAKLIHPRSYIWTSVGWTYHTSKTYDCSWSNTPDQVTVTLIGTAANDVKKGVVIASFNAG